MNICVRVGRRIRALRKQKGFTQDELARRTEVARQTITVLEAGKQEVCLYILGRIVKALGVTLEEFFHGM
jgi:transcriptional regulator with XRE-family HTH domain